MWSRQKHVLLCVSCWMSKYDLSKRKNCVGKFDYSFRRWQVFQYTLVCGFTEEMLSWKGLYMTECSFSTIWRQLLETNVTVHACACVYESKGNNILCLCLHVNVDTCVCVCVCACTCLIVHLACTFTWINVN